MSENARWTQLVQDVMEEACLVSELIVAESVSVLVALESGWDISAVLSATAQLIMDPHYRTFDGFQTLVSREFLSFGHRK